MSAPIASLMALRTTGLLPEMNLRIPSEGRSEVSCRKRTSDGPVRPAARSAARRERDSKASAQSSFSSTRDEFPAPPSPDVHLAAPHRCDGGAEFGFEDAPQGVVGIIAHAVHVEDVIVHVVGHT